MLIEPICTGRLIWLYPWRIWFDYSMLSPSETPTATVVCHAFTIPSSPAVAMAEPSRAKMPSKDMVTWILRDGAQSFTNVHSSWNHMKSRRLIQKNTRTRHSNLRFQPSKLHLREITAPRCASTCAFSNAGPSSQNLSRLMHLRRPF